MASEYQVEVAHGGWGGQIGDRMLVSTIVRIVKRIGDDPNKWEATETSTFHLTGMLPDGSLMRWEKSPQAPRWGFESSSHRRRMAWPAGDS